MSTKAEGPSYERRVLFSSASFEVVQCEWQQGAASPLHQHGWSECYVLIEHGIFEEITQSGFESRRLQKQKGDVIHTAPQASHEIRCLSPKGSTVHVYIPPLSKTATKANFTKQRASQVYDCVSLNLEPRGVSAEELNAVLNTVRDNSVSVHSEYFMNQLFSGIVPEVLQADAIVASAKATLATFEGSPVFTLAEQEVVAAMGAVLGWDRDTVSGLAVPGGSAANFMALHCARQKLFPDSRDEGNRGRKFRIFVSEESHYSWKKGCMALGLGLKAVIAVKANDDGRLNVEDLELKITESRRRDEIPLFVAATAGTTVYGAFDPIRAMAKICQKQSLWLHVDGAWGGPAVFSQTARRLLDGVEAADSMTFDAHKLLGASLTSSLFLTRHGSLLQEANDINADYLFHEQTDVIDRGRLSWQCGRSADAFSFWTLWKRYGSEGLGQFVDGRMALQKTFIDRLRQNKRFKLLHDPAFLNVCVQVVPPTNCADSLTWSKHVRESLRANDKAMVNYSIKSDGTTFLRFILAHRHLDILHLENILEWALAVE